ncbi:MAG: thermonuclease family protein [Alphaproteobacteria bacterium]
MGLFPTSLLALFALLAVPARATETLPGPVPAEIVSVVDGDTLSVRAHIWLGQEVATLVRLAGIDTPELNGACESERVRARAARDYLERAVADGSVTLAQIRYEKYAGRVMAKVAAADGGDLSQRMIAAGHARAYDGGKRLPWCQAAELAKLE